MSWFVKFKQLQTLSCHTQVTNSHLTCTGLYTISVYVVSDSGLETPFIVLHDNTVLYVWTKHGPM